MNNFSPLLPWIQAQHLLPEAVKIHHKKFTNHPAKILQITDFINLDEAIKIGHFLIQEASYESTYGLYSAKGHAVSNKLWCSADEKDRFFNYQMLSKIDPKFCFSPNLLSFIQFRQKLQTEVFKTYISKITGLTLEDVCPIKVHKMQQGHYLKSHNDTHHNRRLAFIFYLSPTWTSNIGGMLMIEEKNGQCTEIEAKFNSLVLFDVTQHKQHFISAIQATAKNHPRLSLSSWFQDRK